MKNDGKNAIEFRFLSDGTFSLVGVVNLRRLPLISLLKKKETDMNITIGNLAVFNFFPEKIQ